MQYTSVSSLYLVPLIFTLLFSPYLFASNSNHPACFIFACIISTRLICNITCWACRYLASLSHLYLHGISLLFKEKKPRRVKTIKLDEARWTNLTIFSILYFPILVKSINTSLIKKGIANITTAIIYINAIKLIQINFISSSSRQSSSGV